MKYLLTNIAPLVIAAIMLLASCSKMETEPTGEPSSSDRLSLQDKIPELSMRSAKAR